MSKTAIDLLMDEIAEKLPKAEDEGGHIEIEISIIQAQHILEEYQNSQEP